MDILYTRLERYISYPCQIIYKCVMVPGAYFSRSLVITFFKAPEGIIAGFCLVVGIGRAIRQAIIQSDGADCFPSLWLQVLSHSLPDFNCCLSAVLWAVCWLLVSFSSSINWFSLVSGLLGLVPTSKVYYCCFVLSASRKDCGSCHIFGTLHTTDIFRSTLRLSQICLRVLQCSLCCKALYFFQHFGLNRADEMVAGMK